jgi:signal transduction histidine kinase/DNA-binding response OmpR family regulator
MAFPPMLNRHWYSPLWYRLVAVLLYNAAFLGGLLWLGDDAEARVRLSNAMQIIGPAIAVVVCAPFRWSKQGRLEQRQHTRRVRRSAVLLWLSSVSFVVGQCIFAVHEVVLQLPVGPNVATLADGVFLSCYAWTIASVLMLPGSRVSTTVRTRVVLDGVMVMLAAATFSWYFILGPMVLAGGAMLPRIAVLLFPLGDIIIGTCVVLLLHKLYAASDVWTVAIHLAGMLVFIASDSVFLALVVRDAYQTGMVSDVGWALGNMLIPVAAWSYARVPRPAHAAQSRSATVNTIRRLYGRGWLPYLLLPAVLGLLLHAMREAVAPQLRYGVFTGGVTLVLLLVVRQILTLNENDRLLAKLQTAYGQLEQQNEANLLAQRQLRHVIESAPVAMAMFDRDMRYMAYSHKWLVDNDCMGEDLIGHSHYEAVPSLPERLRESHRRALAGETLVVMEDPIMLEGQLHYWRWAVTPWYERPGVVGGIILCSDLIDDLVAAREAAIETSRLKSEFLATMSHEIRTPMNAIIGMSELLGTTHLNGDQREYLNIVLDGAQGLLHIINDILDFSKIEAGKLTLEDGEVDVLATVEGVADMLATQARQKQLALMTFVAPDVPRALGGDATRLRQILVNLIGNAIKFTSAGHVIVSVAVAEQNADTVLVRFSVEDSGIGISEAACRHLFQPFTQADGSVTRRFGGTGLGLAIVRRLAELMGGTIEVRSVEGQGSTFSFTARFARRATSGDVAAACDAVACAPRRVLVVDDMPQSSAILSAYAEEWNMQSMVADNGTTALRMLLSTPPSQRFDVAIIDYAMPGMDGLELARAIRREPDLAGIRLILLTAFDERHLAEDALMAGFDAFLSKPVHCDVLQRTIQQLLLPTHARPEAGATVEPVSPSIIEAMSTADHVLVVEDNPVNQKLAVAQLTRLGYVAAVVNNGQEAVDALAQPHPYSCVLMDCQMPVMDGYTAAQAIRRMEAGGDQHIPIIAMTADVVEGTREECLGAGMDDYLSKPVRAEALREMLARWRLAHVAHV